MLTIRSFFTLLLSLVICVTWYSCSDDVCISSYKYEIDAEYSLTNPVVAPNQSFDISLLFPNREFDNKGVNFDNVSKYDFKAALSIRSFSDSTANVDEQANAIDLFTITTVDATEIVESNDVNNAIDLSQSKVYEAAFFRDTMRAINLSLQTAVQDTYILYWTQANPDNERINRGVITGDTCTNVVNFTLQNTAESFDTILRSSTLNNFQAIEGITGAITFIVD